MFRLYDAQKDKEAVYRIWREIGWLAPGKEIAMDYHIAASRALVAEINGQAETLVLTTPGSMRYRQRDLPFSCVSAVTTSHVARKQGLATRLTALALAEAARQGKAVSGLGMFEQGFYNQLGFGTGSYEHIFFFEPARLKATVNARIPIRLTKDDYARVHRARLGRLRCHGSTNLDHENMTRVEMQWDKCFGLGYETADKEISHFVWFHAGSMEHGPYYVEFLAYRNLHQFMELLALLRNLGDQVRQVRMVEPPGVQLQELLKQPFRFRQITNRGPYASQARATAYWQVRILDLHACISAAAKPAEEMRFNLDLRDPVSALLSKEDSWQGIGGKYTVTLGDKAGARTGWENGLPMVKTSVNALTRLWLGVLPATALAVQDFMDAPADLLERLDAYFLLPMPHVDWEF